MKIISSMSVHQWYASCDKSLQAFPLPLFVLQATKAGHGGLGTRLHTVYICTYYNVDQVLEQYAGLMQTHAVREVRACETSEIIQLPWGISLKVRVEARPLNTELSNSCGKPKQ